MWAPAMERRDGEMGGQPLPRSGGQGAVLGQGSAEARRGDAASPEAEPNGAGWALGRVGSARPRGTVFPGASPAPGSIPAAPQGSAAGCERRRRWDPDPSPIPSSPSPPSQTPGRILPRLLSSRGAAQPARDLARSQTGVIQCGNISQGLAEVGTWAGGSWQCPYRGGGQGVRMCWWEQKDEPRPAAPAGAGPHPGHQHWAPTPARLGAAPGCRHCQRGTPARPAHGLLPGGTAPSWREPQAQRDRGRSVRAWGGVFSPVPCQGRGAADARSSLPPAAAAQPPVYSTGKISLLPEGPVPGKRPENAPSPARRRQRGLT